MDLLEREIAFRDLRAALDDAARGEGRLVLVSGEAGIGKTSVVEQFARGQPASVRVLWGVCDALITPRPLGPLHEIGSQAGGELEAALSGSADRSALFRALLAELQQTSIAVVEDVHWADDATLDVLRYVGRRIGRTSAVLVLTYRDDELGAAHPLRPVLSDLVSAASTVRIHPPPLTEFAVHALVGSRDIDASAVYQQTGGNPFFVSEVLSSTGPGLPLSIRDAVLGRIARMSSSAVAVLEAAAVGGPRVESWLLEAMASNAFQAADECLAKGMLLAAGDGFAFRHDLVRQAVLESIAPLRRARLHAVALKALAHAPRGQADLTRLAHHAAGSSDQRAVLEYASRAARQAAAAGAHRGAVDLFARSLSAAAALHVADVAGLLEQHAWECLQVVNLPAAIDSYRQALSVRRTAGDRPGEGKDLALLAVALSTAGQREEARSANQAAIELLETMPPGAELALAYGTQAILDQYTHDLADAIAVAQRAIDLADKTNTRQISTMAYDTLGMSTMYLDYERGCAYLEHARNLAEQAGLDGDVARALADLGSISMRLFQLDRAERYLSDGLAFIAERDLDRLRLYTLGWVALGHMLRGRWSEADATAGEVLSRPASSNARMVALLVRGVVAARRGVSDVTDLDEALEMAGAGDEIRLIGPVRAARAEMAILAGDCPSALEEADAAYRLAVEKRHDWLAGELGYWRWRAGGLREPPPDWVAAPFALQVAGKWQMAADAWRQLGCPYEEARALAEGDFVAQQSALAIFDRLGARPAAAELRRTLRAQGVVRVPRGPRAATRANRFGLTGRQLEILSLLAEGCTNAEIARRMSISAKTAEHHVSAVLAKLEVDTRREAVQLSRENLP